MTPKEKKKKAALLYHLLHSLELSILEKQVTAQKKQLAAIALENQLIIGCATSTFFFDGAWYIYPHDAEIISKKGLNKTLDPSLYRKVAGILKGSFEERKQREFIINTLACALVTCRVSDDLFILVPEIEIEQEQRELFDSFDLGERLTEQEIEQFNQKNKKGLDALKALNMMNLIMAKVTQ